jgi:hypothetical protein
LWWNWLWLRACPLLLGLENILLLFEFRQELASFAEKFIGLHLTVFEFLHLLRRQAPVALTLCDLLA